MQQRKQIRMRLVLGQKFKHDAILGGGCIDRRHPARAVGAVERPLDLGDIQMQGRPLCPGRSRH